MSTLIVLPTGQVVFGEWYATERGQWFLQATAGGMLMFVWEAEYDDGRIVRQFDDVNWSRSMSDPDFVPSEDLRLSVDALERDRVNKFTLYPIALTRRELPWFQQPIEVRVDLKNGFRFVNHWSTDYTPKTGYILRRQVVGVERNDVKVVTVISPSGKFIMCTEENQSFEGE